MTTDETLDSHLGILAFLRCINDYFESKTAMESNYVHYYNHSH